MSKFNWKLSLYWARVLFLFHFWSFQNLIFYFFVINNFLSLELGQKKKEKTYRRHLRAVIMRTAPNMAEQLHDAAAGPACAAAGRQSMFALTVRRTPTDAARALPRCGHSTRLLEVRSTLWQQRVQRPKGTAARMPSQGRWPRCGRGRA